MLAAMSFDSRLIWHKPETRPETQSEKLKGGEKPV
jgi:uncharacterized paraquat-inducible protein A